MSVGVLALQGSFNEHIATLKRLGVEAIEVRKPEQLENVVALIIPGGESTTMAKLAAQYNLIPALREYGSSGKPIWGTCAGLIFLADNVVGQKKGGQDLVGGLDCTVHRNFFGSQLYSFETELEVPALAAVEGGPESFRAVFIRAPAILETGPSVEVLAYYAVSNVTLEKDLNGSVEKVAVAVKQGNLLATAFHPELTSDTRWHSYFLKMLHEGETCSGAIVPLSKSANLQAGGRQLMQPKDLPIYEGSEHLSFEL